jgi:hypothetical protein
LYQDFKWAVIARLDGDTWTIGRAQIEDWLRLHGDPEQDRPGDEDAIEPESRAAPPE